MNRGRGTRGRGQRGQRGRRGGRGRRGRRGRGSFAGPATPRVCSFFQQGRCTKGASCPYLHVKDLSVIPCVHFANGRCRNGDACPYAHGPVLGAKNASPSPRVNVATGNSPTGKQTYVKPSSPVKVVPGSPLTIKPKDPVASSPANVVPGSPLTIKPKDPVASSPANVPSYNASTNKSEPSSAARLPTQIAVALLQHADTIKALTGVRVTRLGSPQIPSGVCLIGSTAQLPYARAALIRLGDPDGCLTVQRVLCSRFRFLAIMHDELEMARIIWKGRRVVLPATGVIALIEGLRIEHSSKGDVIIMLDVCEQNSTGQPTTTATLPATEAVCWDVQDLPDTVDVTHADFGNEVLCAAQLRRAFEVVGSVEAVHRVCQTKAGTIVSRVILAACVDPLSPANAVATLDGSFLAGKMLTVRVAACNSAQRGPGADGFRKSCHATAKALVLKLEVEEHAEALKAKREAARKAANDAASDSDPSELAVSVASEDSSSTASHKVPALSRKEAHKALSSLAARLQGTGTDKETGELASELRKVIRGTWLRHRPRGVCGFHRSFELGRGPACEHGVACRYNHYLAPCRDGDKCKKGNRCCFVHPRDCACLRRLDVHLDKHLGLPADASVDLPALLKALSKHRVAMEKKATQLLEAAHQREASMAAEIQTEEKRDCTTAAEAAQKVATIEAMRGKALELSKQVAEYDRSLQTFLVADPQSFRAARVFARETYNRFPTCLPVYAERGTIQDALREDFAVLILSAETGSGKSTQVVQYLHEMLPGRRVLCTQPRRVAAATLTERVAEELQTTPPTAEGPNLVACSAGGGVRTDTADAKVIFQTDASLLHQLLKRPDLRHVSAVVVDEVHERSVNTDILIALLRRTLHLRAAEGLNPFRVVLTSATMNEALFAQYFARQTWDPNASLDAAWAPVLKVGGRTFPVSVHYERAGQAGDSSQRIRTYQKLAEQKAIALHKKLPDTDLSKRRNHDILIFLSEGGEVEQLSRTLSARLKDCLCVPLHGGLDKDEQRRAFKPADPSKGQRRKIVVATNIAETSVTFDGIGAVIDPGFAKQARYDAAKDATVLRISSISQSSARQRAGRAGRTAPGECHRLYTEEEFHAMDRDQPAELLRADATAAILTVLRFVQRHSDWLTSIEQFPFVEHPGKDRLARALSLLFFLGALTDPASSKLTPRGLAMSRMHFTPRVSATILAAQDLGVEKLACVAMGMASAGRFLFRRGRTDEEKTKAKADRTALAAHFPALGDVGVGIAVWLEARASADEREWCRSHSVSLFQLRMCKRAVRNMHRSLKDEPATTVTKPHLPPKADANPAPRPATRNDLPSVTAASFSDPSLLQRALLVGYHGNLAFLLPQRPGDPHHQPPSYFLPHCNSVARLGSSAAFVMSSEPCPAVAVFMELVESHRLFLGSLFSITAEKLDEMLPEEYRKSSVYAAFKQLNSRRQMLATPSEAITPCAVAYRQLVGARGEAIQSRLPQLRKKFGLGKDSELIVQTNTSRRQILIMSNVVAAREAIAKHLQQELDETAEELANRVDEWAVPGTSVRAVIGMGGECRQLLYGPVESIIVRFSADMLASRLLEPITMVGEIPPGLFEKIADVSGPAPKEAEALSNLRGSLGASRYESKAKSRAGQGTLEKVSMAQVLAAIAYTAGGTACYSINAWLRNLNEAQCHAHEHYIQALQSFQRRRAAHPANVAKRGRVVYRGCMLPRDLLSQYVVDSVVVWPAFTSTTNNIGVARMFGGGGGGNESRASVLFKITTNTWCPLSDVSVFPSEDEVLLPAFSAFTVLKVDAPEGNTSAAVTIVMRRERNAVEALKLCKAVPAASDSGVTNRRGVSDGVGPIVINDKSSRPGLAGVSEIIQKQLRRLDPKVSVHTRCDERSKAVHGRACFTNPAAAAKACALLDGALLGERQLSMVAAPVKTESLSLRNRVVVRVTAVPHKGFATLNCGTTVCALAILRAAAIQRGRGTWGSLFLVDGITKFQLGVKQHTPKRKDEKPRPAWIVVSKIPSAWTARKLREVLAKTFKDMPLNPVVSMPRDFQALEMEEKRLYKLGPSFERARKRWLTKVGGEGLDTLEAVRKGGVGPNGGARYHLWYRTSAHAAAAVERLDGAQMSGAQAHGQRASAALDFSVSICIRGNEHAVIRNELQAIRSADTDARAMINIRPIGRQREPRDVCVTITGEDATGMAKAYQLVQKLQNGVLLPVAPSDRNKVFPRANARRESVRKELYALARKHKCLIIPSFHTSTLRVVAARPAVATISQAIGKFIAGLESEQLVKVPRKIVKKAIAAVEACEGKTRAKAGEKGGVILIGSSKDEMDAARDAVLELLRDDAGENDCVICFGRSDSRLNTCGHPVCNDCGQVYLATHIADLNLPVCCPECDVVLLQEDLHAMGDTSAINIAAVRMFANRTHRDDVVHCSTPDCPQMFDASQTDVTCPVCLFHQCTRCGQGSHPGETCEEYKARMEHEASPEFRIEKVIAHVQAYLLAPSCPSCNAAFIDFSGCFALHCSVCAVGFCGYCLASTGSADPHKHVAKCTFLKKNFPDVGAGYWGGHSSNTFTRCMRVRLAQRVAEYLQEACADDAERRRVVAGLADDIKTSPFFSMDELRKLVPTIV